MTEHQHDQLTAQETVTLAAAAPFMQQVSILFYDAASGQYGETIIHGYPGQVISEDAIIDILIPEAIADAKEQGMDLRICTADEFIEQRVFALEGDSQPLLYKYEFSKAETPLYLRPPCQAFLNCQEAEIAKRKQVLEKVSVCKLLKPTHFQANH